MPDLARSFTYMFEDKNWLSKMLVGAAFVLLSGIIIGIPFLGGYIVAAIKRAYDDEEVPLPEWDNFGDLFGKGIVAFIIVVLLYIPAFVLHFVPCGGLLALFYTLLAMLVFPILLARYAVTNDLNAVFELNEIADLVRDNIANLAAVLIMWIIFSVIAALGVLAIGIGFLFTAFYANLGLAFLYGKVYQEAMKKKDASHVGGEAAS
jgi:hypothetical protein